MQYIIVDLEATCWEGGQPREKMEIIEIGAVALDGATYCVNGEFAAFVQPVSTRTLSEFCISLTSIMQAEVDAALPFNEVFTHFTDWVGPEPVTVCSWGAYDWKQLAQDCERHKIAFPSVLAQHINLKAEFSRVMNVRPTGMAGALAKLGLPLNGRHHRGIDDARNIAEIARLLLPKRTVEEC